jgi:hypothetical protein
MDISSLFESLCLKLNSVAISFFCFKINCILNLECTFSFSLLESLYLSHFQFQFIQQLGSLSMYYCTKEDLSFKF